LFEIDKLPLRKFKGHLYGILPKWGILLTALRDIQLDMWSPGRIPMCVCQKQEMARTNWN
jgi:hypothetical protein